jgi:ESS family glutamate:Na+ symporter
MLGFSQGPGQAFSLGKTWEPLGFESAGAMGLTFAAVGYLWACIIGVILVHRALKKRSDSDNPIRLSPEDRTGLIDDLSKRPEAGKQTTSALAIDSFSFHLCAVCVIYLATYLLLNGAQKLIESFAQGDMVTQIVNTLWGIHFVFATLIALFVRKILDRTGNAELLDNGTLTRICGGSLDFMVTAAIAAISLRVLFLRPGLILATTTIGGLITIAYIYHCLNHAGLSYRLERMASIFGTMTGTLTTGLTLGRITDPQLKSPAPQALVFGAAFTLPLSIPIIFSSLIVTYGRTQPQPMIYYVGTIALTGIYTAAIYLVWRYFIAGKK